jgi:predicted ATPase
MTLIRRIGIQGFRRLNDIDIEMRPMMALIGANGVGKTSFMDALALLAASARSSLNQHLNDLGGVAAVITRDRVGDIALSAEMDVPNYEPLQYNIQVAPRGQNYSIAEEALTQARAGYFVPFKHVESQHGVVRYYDPAGSRLVQPDWVYDSQESALSQVPRMFPEPENLRRILSSVTQYHVLDVGRRAPVKLPQQLRPAALPGENGDDLAPFLYNLRETNHGKYEAVEDSLRAAFPGFESLSFPIVATGMISMTWKEKTFRNPFYTHELSEGTLRFLWLVSLLQSPSLSTITMIDEPEVSLHPELLALLADLMREASNRTQIIVATHSDRLVRFLEPKEIMVMDIEEDGASSMSWADSLDIEAWLAEYSLDEAWQMGVIGGRA